MVNVKSPVVLWVIAGSLLYLLQVTCVADEKCFEDRFVYLIIIIFQGS